MNPQDEVIAKALNLPAEDLAYVVQAIESELTPESDSGEVLTGDAFYAELKRRSAAYRAGTTTARDAEDVIRDLRLRQSSGTRQ